MKKRIENELRQARLINEIQDVINLDIKPQYKQVIINVMIEKWRDYQ